jgi:hypothetical protein
MRKLRFLKLEMASFTNINDCSEFYFQSAPTILARKRDRKIKLYGDLRGDGLGDG